jgi:hypothetical protein
LHELFNAGEKAPDIDSTPVEEACMRNWICLYKKWKESQKVRKECERHRTTSGAKADTYHNLPKVDLMNWVREKHRNVNAHPQETARLWHP